MLGLIFDHHLAVGFVFSHTVAQRFPGILVGNDGSVPFWVLNGLYPARWWLVLKPFQNRRRHHKTVLARQIVLGRQTVLLRQNFLAKWSDRFGNRHWCVHVYFRALRESVGDKLVIELALYHRKVPVPVNSDSMFHRVPYCSVGSTFALFMGGSWSSRSMSDSLLRFRFMRSNSNPGAKRKARMSSTQRWEANRFVGDHDCWSSSNGRLPCKSITK